LLKTLRFVCACSALRRQSAQREIL